MKAKTFKSKTSTLSVEVIEDGLISITNDDKDKGEEQSIFIGAIDGARSRLIEAAFAYAKENKLKKKRYVK